MVQAATLSCRRSFKEGAPCSAGKGSCPRDGGSHRIFDGRPWKQRDTASTSERSSSRGVGNIKALVLASHQEKPQTLAQHQVGAAATEGLSFTPMVLGFVSNIDECAPTNIHDGGLANSGCESSFAQGHWDTDKVHGCRRLFGNEGLQLFHPPRDNAAF